MSTYNCKMISRHSDNKSIIGIFAPVQEIIDEWNKRSNGCGKDLSEVEFTIRLSEDDYPIKHDDSVYVNNIDEVISDLENMTKPNMYRSNGVGQTNHCTVQSNWIELYCKDKDKPNEVFPGDYSCKCLIESLSIHDYRHIDVEKYKDKIIENPFYGQHCINKADVGKVIVYLTLLIG